MRDQITVRLPADLRAALGHASRRLRLRNSDVVRMALAAFLNVGDRTASKPSARVRRLIGSVDSGMPDLAERYRQYVIDALKRGR